MKFLKFKQIGLVLIMLMSMVACVKDPEPTPEIFRGWGFIYTLSDDYYITLDGGLVLKIANFDDPDAIALIEENDRIMFTFIKKESPEDNPVYDHEIELQGFAIMDYTSEIIELNDASRDTIGDGFVALGNFTDINGEFLNLEIIYRQEEGSHLFSLCYDETVQEEDKPVILQLRNYFKEEKDGSTQNVSKLHTFNISDVPTWQTPNNDGVFEFLLRINSGDSQEKDFLFKYNTED